MARPLPPLNALRAFEAAARHLSFSRAAEELHVTPAAVSHQIKQLEEHLTIRLFHRRNRAVHLTEAGVGYLLVVRDAFDRLTAATVRLAEQDQVGHLVVAVLPSFAAKWLVPRLPRFRALAPDIDVNIAASHDMVDLVGGEADVAIRYGRGAWPGLKALRFLAEEVFPVCSPNLLKNGRAILEPDDLVHHLLLHDEPDKRYPYLDWPTWLRTAGATRVDSARGPTFSDSSMLLQAAIDGQGVALGRSVLVSDDLAAGRLVKPFALSFPANAAYWLVAPPEAWDRPKIKAFREWLLDEAK
jgi:LysR family transcriptional regulator, glycine cleavage system transcriptional activator